ncbi:MAG: bifunctional riboflavin kinase/FAD synthetase [Deltaproteobacteria bacterium]
MVDVLHGAASVDPPLEGSVVTLGAFDGVHLGHRALIRRAVDAAKQLGVPSVGYTFYPHPAKIIAPTMAPKLLVSIERRAALMRAAGLDHVLVEPFDAAFAQVTADAFVADYLVRALHPKHVVVGFNFFYGHKRGGDTNHLKASGAKHGFEVEVVEPVESGTVVASSTAIREYLLEGNVAAAHTLLGRDFALAGTVVEGDKRGRTIGFPTANLNPDSELLPANGVYATRVRLEGKLHDAVTNVGVRPTFDGTRPTVETFLLDWSGDLYGRRIEVDFVARLRDERRFDGIDALKAQLARDVDAARAALGA